MAGRSARRKAPRRAPSPRKGLESFRYRSAIVRDGSGGAPDFASSGSASVDADDVVSSERLSASGVALQRLVKSAPPLSNDLRLKNDLDGVKEGAEEDEPPPDDCARAGVEVDGDGEVSETSPSNAAQSLEPAAASQRNAGQCTVIAFVNSASGGGMGTTIMQSLQSHLGPTHVFDLHSCRPGNMPEDILIKYATDPMVRVLACGGDGTCGWIFSSLDKVWSTVLGPTCRVHLSQYKDHLPLAIMPLGTGNDLSRQFHWGPTFQANMKEKSMIASVQASKLTALDRWRCIILPVNELQDDEKQLIPKILGSVSQDAIPEEDGDEELPIQRQTTLNLLQTLLKDDDLAPPPTLSRKAQKRLAKSPDPSAQFFDGVFCNYFSLGFDALVAYLFHHEREAHPEKFTSPMKNKIVYVQKAPHAFKAPQLRKRVKLLVNNDKGELVRLKIPKFCRAIVLLNIQSYAAGNHLSKKGSPTDGMVEVIFVSNLIRAMSSAMAPAMPFLYFRVAAQTDNVCIRTTCPLHCQVDGEPWLQGEGVIQVKFHSRNSILEKVNDEISCGCMGRTKEAVIS